MSYLFGARLLELRTAAGLTLRELASALGTDHTYLSHIENGRRAPTQEMLQNIATHFGEDLDILRLQAGQVPERILSIMQQRPQLTLSLLGSLEEDDRSAAWRYSVQDILDYHSPDDQLPALVDYDCPPFTRPVQAGKNTAIYNAHSYHTKVPYQGIIPFLEHYTQEGDLVADPFCGSGMTGVAALLTNRDAILSDLSPAAVHIARNYNTPADPQEIDATWHDLLPRVERLSAELYGTTCARCGDGALIEYTIFTDVFQCTACAAEMTLWDHGRDDTGKLTGSILCPECHAEHDKNAVPWLTSVPCSVNTSCRSCRGRHERPPMDAEVRSLEALAGVEPPGWVPQVPFGPDWEMWRQGHADRGIDSVRAFFTPRNLHALSALHTLIQDVHQERTKQALLFAFTGSVNRASKRYQWNHKRPTNVLGGTLYVSSLFYEFNVMRLFERKVKAALRLFASTYGAKGRVAVDQASATALAHLPNDSIDYVFTDPPFGSNIYYADVSLLWEAWLGDLTDRSRQMVIGAAGPRGPKSLEDYKEMLTLALKEIRRVLKPERWATVVFHSSNGSVWQAVRDACIEAGFTLANASMFDKKQRSFKALKALSAGERVANFDVVLNLQKRSPVLTDRAEDVPTEARLLDRLREHLARAGEADGEARSTAYLHSLAVQEAWTSDLDLMAVDLARFEELLSGAFRKTKSGWDLRDGAVSRGAGGSA